MKRNIIGCLIFGNLSPREMEILGMTQHFDLTEEDWDKVERVCCKVQDMFIEEGMRNDLAYIVASEFVNNYFNDILEGIAHLDSIRSKKNK